MKDIYKQKVSNALESCQHRAKVVREMVTGERPADSKQADSYLNKCTKHLEEIKNLLKGDKPYEIQNFIIRISSPFCSI